MHHAALNPYKGNIVLRDEFNHLKLMEVKMKKIFLIGIPGCGKSTLGKQLAEKLKMPFFDTDELLLNYVDPDRPYDLFRLAFNGRFVSVLKKIMLELVKEEGNAVISTAAEVALIPGCVYLMKEFGIIVHIKCDSEIAVSNLRESTKNGFVLEIDGERIDTNKENVKLYMEDHSKYEAIADLTLENNGTEEEGLKKLLGLVNFNDLK